MTFASRSASWLLGLLLASPLSAACAQDKPAPNMDKLQAEFEAAVADARGAAVQGPSDVALRDQAVLKLPQGYTYFPSKQSGRLLRAMGNRLTEDPLGMVVPAGDSDQWFVVVQYDAAGYVKDDDAKNWDAADLLKNIREGTAAANEERRAKGIPESEIIGWIEKPTYDATQHRLVWSLASKLKGEPEQSERTVNYNTYALGREGYVSLNLVTGANGIEADKRHARALLSALDFNSGKKYQEFDSSTDKVAAYGLAALVGGVAAKKLGLLALAGAFILKFAKVIGLAVIGGLAVLGKYFKGRKGKDGDASGGGTA